MFNSFFSSITLAGALAQATRTAHVQDALRLSRMDQAAEAKPRGK